MSCADRTGVVTAVASFLIDQHRNVIDGAQFGDSTLAKIFSVKRG
jgi:formyltetrahydrofolate hydrolase